MQVVRVVISFDEIEVEQRRVTVRFELESKRIDMCVQCRDQGLHVVVEVLHQPFLWHAVRIKRQSCGVVPHRDTDKQMVDLQLVNDGVFHGLLVPL